MGGIKWKHTTDQTDLSTRASYTVFDNTLSLRQPQLEIKAPSSLQQAAIAHDGICSFGKYLFKWGIDANYYRIQPQWATYTIEDETIGSRKQIHEMGDYKLATEIKIPVFSRFSVTPGVRLSGVVTRDDYRQTDISPLLLMEFTTRRHTIRLRAGRYCQYLHLVGLSEIGLASDFWMAPDRNTPRQSMWDFALSSRSLLPLGLKLETSVYYKRVFNQPEYFGNVIDIIDTSYDAVTHMRDYNGYNTGFNIDLRRETGDLTGSINYSFGIARRKNPQTGEWFRAVTETLNSLGADLSYRFNDRWTFGATFTYATGRPYTPVKSIYLIGGTIGMEYGKPNSAFFPSYQRLDLSVTYSMTSMFHNKRKLHHLINFSLLNAYGHKNVDMQYFILKLDMDQYRLKRIYSLYQFVPSISYTLQF